MRTTIDIPDDLLAKATRIAAESKRPLRAVIADTLREALDRRRPARRALPVALTLCGGSGLQPGVDLDDTDAFLAALAIESGSEWITTDRDYARFPGLRWRHPLA